MTNRLQQHRLGLCVRAALLGAAPMLALGIAHAATITVDSLADGMPASDGVCTLREAIINANGDDQSGSVDCDSGTGEDLIRFQLPGTVALGSALPSFSDPERTTIDGDIDADGSNDIVISGNSASHLVDLSLGAAAAMRHLSLVDGNREESGGAIRNEGALELSHCTVSGNTTMTYGGAIYNDLDGTLLSIDHCTFFNNHSKNSGGAIDNNTALTVTNSTFHGNISDVRGGTISVYAGNVEILHSSLSGNIAPAGGAIFLYDNGQAVTVTNTLIADNGGGNCARIREAMLIDGGGNLRWPVTDNSCVGFFIDPMLGPLQDNGGATWTMLPGSGSVAVDVIACNAAVTDDQRGVARPQGAACDVGAVEVSAVDLDRIFANGFDRF